MSFAAVLSRLSKLENPYPGLRPFDTNEAPLFFGRDQQVLDLSDRLGRNHFVAVLGLSGSGKSSLVRAGLIPALERGRLLEPGHTWRIALTRPSGAPFANLATALQCDPAELRASSHGLIDFARRQLKPQQEALLVLVDQFEEVFRYKDSATLTPANAASSEAAAFIALLLASARSPLPLYIVLTMRTDYLGDCAEFPDFPEALNESQYLVPRLTREQRRQAIEGPLGRARISSALVERILNDAGDEPDQLPILQHALMRTWAHWHLASPDNTRAIDNEDYAAIGGFSDALNQHADELLKTPAVLAATTFVEIIFKRLTALGRGNRERRDPSPLAELWELCKAKTDQQRQRVNDIIDVFRKGEATFLAPREGDLVAGTFIDIAHESLIRNWKVLSQQWLPDEEKHRKTLVELLDRARGWRAHEKGVLTGLDLASAERWDRSRNPSSKWAEHYVGVGAIDEVQFFLAASRKHRLAVRAFFFFLLLLAIGGLFKEWQTQKVNQSLNLAGKAEDFVSLGRNSVALATATQAFTVNKTGQARQALAHSFPQELLELKSESEPVYRASFSPDESLVLTVSANETAEVWNATTGHMTARLLGHDGEIHSARFSPDGKRIVTASSDRTARIWDAFTGNKIASLAKHSSDVNTAVYSPDGKFIVTASNDWTARLWDASNSQPLSILKGHTGPVLMAGVSPDSSRIATASSDSTARLWNASTGQLTATLQGHTSDVKTAVFSPDNQHIVTASADHTARIWNALSGQPQATLVGHTKTVNSAVFSPDGQRIVTASDDQTGAIWNAATGQLLLKLEGHSGPINSALFSANGQYVVTASRDGTAHVWNSATGDMIANLTGHTIAVNSATFSAKGLRVLTAEDDNAARVWNLAAAAEVLTTLTGHADGVSSAVFSPDGRRVLTASEDRTAQVWENGESILKLSGHFGSVNTAAFSPDGRRIVTASADHTACIWNSSNGQVITKLIGHSEAVNSAAFDPEGSRIVTASDDHSARIWVAATGQLITQITGHRGTVRNAVFSPNGQLIVTASDDTTSWIWNASTGKVITKLIGHKGTVWTAAFSPDSQRVITAGDDGTVRIWNAATGQLISNLQGHTGPVYSAAFSPDGKSIVTASNDETVRVWDAATGQVTAKLEGHSDTVGTAAFSHDGQRIVTASLDRTSLIFRLVTLNEITTLLTSK